MVENFAELSVEEQVNVAKTFVEKINSENVFADNTSFVFDDVEPDDITGGLYIYASLANPIEVSREASWCASDEDEAEVDPGYEAEYVNLLRDDTKKSFKTSTAVVDGYNVSLRIDDIEEDETIDAEVVVDNISHEDSGIGGYEYFGARGYDSHPYVEVEGTITRMCDCNITFIVEPIDTTAINLEI